MSSSSKLRCGLSWPPGAATAVHAAEREAGASTFGLPAAQAGSSPAPAVIPPVGPDGSPCDGGAGSWRNVGALGPGPAERRLVVASSLLPVGGLASGRAGCGVWLGQAGAGSGGGEWAGSLRVGSPNPAALAVIADGGGLPNAGCPNDPAGAGCGVGDLAGWIIGPPIGEVCLRGPSLATAARAAAWACSTIMKKEASSVISPSRFQVSPVREVSESRVTFCSTIHCCRVVSSRKRWISPLGLRISHRRSPPGSCPPGGDRLWLIRSPKGEIQRFRELTTD